MTRRLLIVFMIVLALSLASMFLPARELSIGGIGRLSFESKITLSIGSETAYAAPDIITNSPTADSGGWTDPTNAYADGGGYASITSGTPSVSHTYSGYGFNLTGNPINQVRVRYDAYSAQYSTTTANAYPTSDQEINGTWTVTPASPTTRYTKIDDTNTDTDYITCTALAGGSGSTYYGFSAFTVPSSATITNLTIYYRARQASSGISFRSAGAVATANGGNVTPALPAGWQVNDLFICMIASRDNVNATMPGGWTAIDAGTINGAGLRTTSFYRRALSGDTAPTVTHTGGNRISAVIVAYSGVITTGSPIDVTGATSVNTPASTTMRFHASGITTTTNNDLVVELGGTSNRATCSTYTGTPTPTERADGPNANNFPEVIIADFIQATAGGTGARSATLSASQLSNGKLVSFKPQPPATQVAAAIKVGGTLYGTTDPGVNPATSFTTYSYAFTTNPQTGLAWTAADINGTGSNPLQEMGVYTNNTTPNLSVSGLYAVVNYTGYNQIRVDVWDGTSWSSPQQVTTLTGAEATYWYNVTGVTTWTAEKLANIMVRVDAYTAGTASTVYLDWLPVEVDYSLSPVTGWLCGWEKRVKLTIDRNDISSPLTDFPVLVYLSTSSGRGPDDVSFVFDELQSDANRFKIAVTTNDGIAECYVEIEKWSQASEKAWLWVRVLNINNTVDTDLYLYYDRNHADNNKHVGDTNATYVIEGDSYTPAEQVWDGSYKLIQHLGENTTVDPTHDSTANNNDETNPPPLPPSGDPDPGYVRAIYTDSGRIDGGYSFAPIGGNGTRLQMDHSTSLDITTAITLETFIYLNNKTEDMKFISKDDPFPGGRGCYCLQQELRGGVYQLELQLDFGAWYRASYATYSAGQWYYLVGTYDGTTMLLYLNGTQVATYSYTGTMTSNPLVALGLGNRAYDVTTSYDLNGLLDEVRISDTPRSAAWIRAGYESGRDHLIDFGAEEIYPADIENIPAELDFGYVDENNSYWAKTGETGPSTWPLIDEDCFFTITNNGDCAVKISIRATDFLNPDLTLGWTLSGSPGLNTVTLKAGRSGDNSENDMVTLTTSNQSFILSLGTSPNQSRGWELKLEMGTFSPTDYDEKTSTITLTATSA